MKREKREKINHCVCADRNNTHARIKVEKISHADRHAHKERKRKKKIVNFNFQAKNLSLLIHGRER